MKNLFYGVLVLYLIFFISCSGRLIPKRGIVLQLRSTKI